MKVWKYLIFIGLICTHHLTFGQKKEDVLSIPSQFWGEDDPAKNTLSHPEKWKSKSAVILFQSFDYVYENKFSSIDFVEALRRRIKLMDKSAVEEHSQFLFTEKFKVKKGSYGKEGILHTGFKIIKPDGTEKIIDTKDAVEFETDKQLVKKIAIPGLEVGDIIDYYLYASESFYANRSYNFDPYISTLQSSYPIVEQRISFTVEKDFFVNFNSFRGAPVLKKEEIPQSKFVKYTLLDKDRESFDEPRWFYPYRVLPIIKFQVVFSKKKKGPEVHAFLSSSRQVKKSVSESEVLDYYKRRLYFDIYFQNVSRGLAREGKWSHNNQYSLMRQSYYHSRFRKLIRYQESLIFKEEEYLENAPLRYFSPMGEEDFIKHFGSFLKCQGIQFDVVVAVSKEYGSLDQLLFTEETTLLLKLRHTPVYISPFAYHTNFNHIPEYLEGTQAHLLVLDKNYEISDIQPIQIPTSSSDDNNQKQVSQFRLTEDKDRCLVSRKTFLTGNHKLSYQERHLRYFDIFAEEYPKFKTRNYLESITLKEKVKKNVQNKYVEKQEEDRENQREGFKAMVETELDMEVSDYEVDIMSTGRMGKSQPFSYEETFEIKADFLKQVGENYLFEIGKCIGGQIALQKDELERNQDIYMPFAKSYDHTVILDIPEGYTVKGLDKLEVNVQNETGGFVSTVRMEDEKLVVHARKYYAKSFETADKWPMMVEFLEAAYQFTQEVILIKKEMN